MRNLWLLRARRSDLGAIVRRGLPEPERAGGGGFLGRNFLTPESNHLCPTVAGLPQTIQVACVIALLQALQALNSRRACPCSVPSPEMYCSRRY